VPVPIARLKRAIVAYALAALFFAGLVPATPSFADASAVTLTIVAQPVTRISLDLVYDPAIEGAALVVTTSTIAQLP
jgi:hypothetical protein